MLIFISGGRPPSCAKPKCLYARHNIYIYTFTEYRAHAHTHRTRRPFIMLFHLNGEKMSAVIKSSKISLFVVITLRSNLWLNQCEIENKKKKRKHERKGSKCFSWGGAGRSMEGGKGCLSHWSSFKHAFALFLNGHLYISFTYLTI